jgi:RimJ/RimL family protein N-acetyltransferase
MSPEARELRTERLFLRPGRRDELAAVHALWIDAAVRRFLFDDRSLSLEETASFLEQSERAFAERGAGIWLASTVEDGPPIGFAGLLFSETGPPNLVVGLRPTHWGNGLAAEAARAVLRHSFETLALPEIVADVDEPNLRSIALLERIGMSLEGRVEREGRPLRLYRVSRAAKLSS